MEKTIGVLLNNDLEHKKAIDAQNAADNLQKIYKTLNEDAIKIANTIIQKCEQNEVKWRGESIVTEIKLDTINKYHYRFQYNNTTEICVIVNNIIRAHDIQIKELIFEEISFGANATWESGCCKTFVNCLVSNIFCCIPLFVYWIPAAIYNAYKSSNHYNITANLSIVLKVYKE